MEDQLGPAVLGRTRLIAELEARYSKEDVLKIARGNLLRVLRAVLPG
jgi:microsomal dipeptidase-like Zn-dependent dipeptidase